MSICRRALLLALLVTATGCSGGTSSFGSGSDGGLILGLDAHLAFDANHGVKTPTVGDAHTTQEPDSGAVSGDSGFTPGNNVAPLIVDEGPAGAESINTPFVTITICIPGTSTCQTIDHITVDTGSSGVHIIGSVLNGNMMLPQAMASTGLPLEECEQYVDSAVWGSVRMADVKIAGEVASSIPIQIIADPSAPSAPTDCTMSGMLELTDTVVDYGANGLVGINQIVQDCGEACAESPPPPGAYYSCSGSTCTAVSVPLSKQIQNPIALFEHDNNGSIVSFQGASAPATGAATLAGSLIFGIGTQANNAVGSATVLTTDDYGNITTIFNGQTLSESYFDTGTSAYAFADNSIVQCGQNDEWAGSYCPASTANLTATNEGMNGASASASLAIADADSFGDTDTVFPDLGETADGNDSFAWGFPFFINRNVYIALAGASTPSGMGPYYAY